MIDQPLMTPRSPHWSHARAVFLHLKPYCEVCGRKAPDVEVEVHHEIPVNYLVDPVVDRPDLELDPRIMSGLCTAADCQGHYLVGHLGDWHSYNPELARFLAWTADLKRDQIVGLRQWQSFRLCRPKHVGAMTVEEKLRLRDMLNQRFPAMPPVVRG